MGADVSELERLADAIVRKLGIPPADNDLDRRLAKVEATLDRIIGALEKLSSVDERVTDIERQRLIEQGRAQANAQRTDNLKWLLQWMGPGGLLLGAAAAIKAFTGS